MKLLLSILLEDYADQATRSSTIRNSVMGSFPLELGSVDPFRTGSGSESESSTGSNLEIDEHVNCTCEMFDSSFSETYQQFNDVVILYSLPMVALFGVVTNVLNVLVYSRTQMMRCSGNRYLMSLAGSDFFVVILGGFTFWCDSVKAHFHQPEVISIINRVLVWVLPFGYVAQTASIYFTLAAAIDCYLLVCWPCCAKKWCTPKKASKAIPCVVAWSITYNIVRFWTLKTDQCSLWSSEQQNWSEIFEICPTEMYDNINEFYNVYLYLILMTLLPFLLLSILNGLIIRNVRLRKRFFAVFYIRNMSATLLRSTSLASPNLQKPENRESFAADGETDTITLIMVVVLFLCCNVLALIVNMTENFFEVDGELLNYMADVSNFLVIFNSSANFVIYVRFSKEFRTILVALFQRTFRKRQSLTQSLTGAAGSMSTDSRLGNGSLRVSESQKPKTEKTGFLAADRSTEEQQDSNHNFQQLPQLSELSTTMCDDEQQLCDSCYSCDRDTTSFSCPLIAHSNCSNCCSVLRPSKSISGGIESPCFDTRAARLRRLLTASETFEYADC